MQLWLQESRDGGNAATFLQESSNERQERPSPGRQPCLRLLWKSTEHLREANESGGQKQRSAGPTEESYVPTCWLGLG